MPSLFGIRCPFFSILSEQSLGDNIFEEAEGE